MFLRNCWYVAAWDHELDDGFLARTILGEPIVLFRAADGKPRADDLPSFVSELDESQPCTHNPLGAKGCGESGSIGAPAALVAAVLDALAPFGVEDIGMPLTAERVWRAMEDARAVTG